MGRRGAGQQASEHLDADDADDADAADKAAAFLERCEAHRFPVVSLGGVPV